MGSADAPKVPPNPNPNPDPNPNPNPNPNQVEAPKAAAPKAAPKAGGKVLTMEEVEKHNTEEDCWIVVKDRVYDATKYLDSHPGGRSSIAIASGSDASDDFEALHSSKAWKLLEEYYIGTLGEGMQGGGGDAEPASAAAPTGAAPPNGAVAAEEVPVEAVKALDPKKWVSLTLTADR